MSNTNIDNLFAYALRGAKKLDTNMINQLKGLFSELEKEYEGKNDTKFKIGNQVYLIRVNRSIPCGACQGLGTRLIRLFSDEDRTIFHDKMCRCSECQGIGTVYSGKRKNHYVSDVPFIVSKIRIRDNSDGKMVSYSLENTVACTSADTKYVDETKTDKFYENQIFATKEEAQAACDYLNKLEEAQITNNDLNKAIQQPQQDSIVIPNITTRFTQFSDMELDVLRSIGYRKCINDDVTICKLNLYDEICKEQDRRWRTKNIGLLGSMYEPEKILTAKEDNTPCQN